MYKVIVNTSIWTQEEKIVENHINQIQNHYVPKGHLQSPEPEVAILKKEIEIPFPPFLGLEIAFNDWDCPPLRSVTWMADIEKFYCTVDDSYPGMAVDTYLSYEDLVEMKLECGWERPIKSGGNAPKTNPSRSD